MAQSILEVQIGVVGVRNRNDRRFDLMGVL